MNRNLVAIKNDPVGKEKEPSSFPVPFTLQDFQHDILQLYCLYVNLVATISDNFESPFRFLNRPSSEGYISFEDPAELQTKLDFTYEDIRNSWLARSLETMYRYAYHGELDNTVEELGPAGYHVGIAALVKDMSVSSHLKFILWSADDKGRIRNSVENCLRTVELANARLTLEGQPRFFNFDSKDEDYDALIEGDTPGAHQGGYGAALTVRQMSLLSGMGEMSIRTLANPKRANQIPTDNSLGRTLVLIEDAKAWLMEKKRYVPIRVGVDGAVLDLKNRRFDSMKDLSSVVTTRLTALGESGSSNGQRLQDLMDRLGITVVDKAAYSNTEFLCGLAEILRFPSDMFILRVRETLLNEELAAVRREVRTASRHISA
jgi:hypothetical protein